jgi:Flp pilus assembly protein TadD
LTGQKEPMMLGTLAAAYAEAGRFEEAETTAQKAESLAVQAGNPLLAQKNRQMSQRFQNRQPFHGSGPASVPSTPAIP